VRRLRKAHSAAVGRARLLWLLLLHMLCLGMLLVLLLLHRVPVWVRGPCRLLLVQAETLGILIGQAEVSLVVLAFAWLGVVDFTRHDYCRRSFFPESWCVAIVVDADLVGAYWLLSVTETVRIEMQCSIEALSFYEAERGGSNSRILIVG